MLTLIYVLVLNGEITIGVWQSLGTGREWEGVGCCCV